MASADAATSAKPNIVFILADDLGWADVAFHGGPAPTPHLDRLVRQGVELTQHYVAPVCTPTRAGFMTGRYWSRFGIYGVVSTRVLPWNTITLPRALKRVGYDTAQIGKWHLGSKPEWGPSHFGFDHSYGSLGGGVGPYKHEYKQGPYAETWHRNGQPVVEEGHVTDLLLKEAEGWIAARSSAPFFLYLPFTAVHLPIKEPPEWVDRVPPAITGDLARHHAACIMHLDDAVGRIVAAVARVGKRDNTLIVFSSDNGGSREENNDLKYPTDNYPAGHIPGNNAPLRGGKGNLYEGGIRAPTVVVWPGKIAPGNSGVPAHIVDWMPTFCALAGFVPERDLQWDGIDLWPLITRRDRSPPPRPLYVAHLKGNVLRSGDWKLIVGKDSGETKGRTELFDLVRDPYERTDLASRRPDIVQRLTRILAEMSKKDGDAMPD